VTKTRDSNPRRPDGGNDVPRVVISDTKLSTLETEYAVFGDDVELVHDLVRSPAAMTALEPNAIIVDASTPMTAETIASYSGLEVIVRAGVGIDNIDVAAARECGVSVSNVPDYGIDEVSAHALALALSLVRGLHVAADDTSDGGWDWEVAAPLHRPEALTFGVVGYGRIGSRTVEKALPQFGNVLVADPYVADESILDGGAEPVAFDLLLEKSDVLSVHTPLTSETHTVFDRDAFDAMGAGDGPGPIFVNTARGPVVDTDALVAALDDGRVRRAGLDVLATEPPVDARLTGRRDVLVTPHVAWYTEESKHEVRQKAAEEARRLLAGDEGNYRVD
jgi:D-3-phosphoglycerate dehydrogenase